MDISSDREANSDNEDRSEKLANARPSAPVPSTVRMGGAGMGRGSPASSPRMNRPLAAKTRERSNNISQLSTPLCSGEKGVLHSPALTNLGEPVGQERMK